MKEKKGNIIDKIKENVATNVGTSLVLCIIAFIIISVLGLKINKSQLGPFEVESSKNETEENLTSKKTPEIKLIESIPYYDEQFELSIETTNIYHDREAIGLIVTNLKGDKFNTKLSLEEFLTIKINTEEIRVKLRGISKPDESEKWAKIIVFPVN